LAEPKTTSLFGLDGTLQP